MNIRVFKVKNRFAILITGKKEENLLGNE